MNFQIELFNFMIFVCGSCVIGFVNDLFPLKRREQNTVYLNSIAAVPGISFVADWIVYSYF